MIKEYLPVSEELLENNNFNNYKNKNLFYKLTYTFYDKFEEFIRKKKKIKILGSEVRNKNFIGLEVGGGESPTRKKYGYINCDIRNLPEVDIVSSALEINSHFEPKSVDIIYGRHFLEHLTWSEVEEFLIKSKLLLKDNGKIELIVPSFWFHAIQMFFFKPYSDVFLHALAGLNGWQRDQIKGNYWDIHKSTFNHSIIKNLSKIYDFKVLFIKSQPKEIHFIFQKVSL